MVVLELANSRLQATGFLQVAVVVPKYLDYLRRANLYEEVGQNRWQLRCGSQIIGFPGIYHVYDASIQPSEQVCNTLCDCGSVFERKHLHRVNQKYPLITVKLQSVGARHPIQSTSDARHCRIKLGNALVRGVHKSYTSPTRRRTST